MQHVGPVAGERLHDFGHIENVVDFLLGEVPDRDYVSAGKILGFRQISRRVRAKGVEPITSLGETNCPVKD